MNGLFVTYKLKLVAAGNTRLESQAKQANEILKHSKGTYLYVPWRACRDYADGPCVLGSGFVERCVPRAVEILAENTGKACSVLKKTTVSPDSLGEKIRRMECFIQEGKGPEMLTISISMVFFLRTL